MLGKDFVIDDYSGGVNLEASPYAIDQNQARDLLNVTTSAIGSVKKRDGFTPISIPPLITTSLSTFERGSSKFLIGIGDNGTSTDIYSFNTSGAKASIKGSADVTINRLWEGIQAPIINGQGPTFLINGFDQPLQWTGTGKVNNWNASSGSVPNGKYVIYHDNRVLVAGVETDYTTRSTLYASEIGNPLSWAPPNGVTNIFDPDDGQEISALGKVGPYSLVFKPRKLFVVTDTDSLGYRNLSDQIGCIAHRSVVSTEKGTFFLTSDRKICVTDGSTIETLSGPIDPLLKKITKNFLSFAAAFYKNNKYYISVGIDRINDTILEYDLENGSWWIHKIAIAPTINTGVLDWALLDPKANATLYSVGANANILFKAFESNRFSDSYLFNSHWATGWNTFGQPHIRKTLRQVRTSTLGESNFYSAKSFASTYLSENGIIWEQSEADETLFGGEGTFGGAGTFGTPSPIFENRYYTLGTATSWSFKFENLSDQHWELYSHTIAADPRTD